MDSKGNKCTKRDARKLAITDVLADEDWGTENVPTAVKKSELLYCSS